MQLDWRVIVSTASRNTHDRWVIGDESARFVSNANAIVSGQHSELNLSSQREELARLFDAYSLKGLRLRTSGSRNRLAHGGRRHLRNRLKGGLSVRRWLKR
jgi:hypothetical protein